MAYLVEAADDICYATIDLEDAVELGIVDFRQVSDLLLSAFSAPEREAIRAEFSNQTHYRVNLARLRGPVYDQLVRAAVEGFTLGYENIMRGEEADNLFSYLPGNNPWKSTIKNALRMAKRSIYTDQKKTEIELGCFSTFETLLREFSCAAVEQGYLSRPSVAPLSRKSALVLKLLGDHGPNEHNAPQSAGKWTTHLCLRRVLDFVCGMTDNYAIYIANQMRGTGVTGVQRP